MQSERERAHLEVHDEVYTSDVEQVDDILNQTMRTQAGEVTYIPVVLTETTRRKVIVYQQQTLSSYADVTRAGLRGAMTEGLVPEFISKSHIHRYGLHLTGTEAVATWGSVAFEVRNERGSLIAVVDYCAHPAFGDGPVHAEVTGRVR